MKRKLTMMALAAVLTLTFIPTLAAYADELDLNGGPAPVLEENQDQDSNQDQENDQDDQGVVEEEGADQEEGAAVEVELPKINLKSPVTKVSESDIGTQFTLIARVGAETVDAALVTWTSDNEAVATISPEGIVTVVGVGKANFTASMIDGSARNGYAKVFVSAEKEAKETKAEKGKKVKESE